MTDLILQPVNAKKKTRTMASFLPVWQSTKAFEGGFQQLKNDSANYCPAKGKPGSKLIGTKYGISAIAYAEYFKRCPTIEDIKNLTPELAQKIAKAQYWNPLQADKLNNQGVAHLVFDSLYTSGSYGTLHARKAINKLLGKDTVKEYKSFKLSDKEISMINSIPAAKYFDTLVSIRKDFFHGLRYEDGYLNRIGKLISAYAESFSEPVQLVKHHPKSSGLVFGVVVLAVIATIVVRQKVKTKRSLKAI